jgi:hypothetical protein
MLLDSDSSDSKDTSDPDDDSIANEVGVRSQLETAMDSKEREEEEE